MRNATPTSRLTQQERHAQILAVLRRDGAVRVATLAKLFDVTTETARRDLDELAESGALQRTYGGGAMRSLIDEPGIGLRGLVHTPERTRIEERGYTILLTMGDQESDLTGGHAQATFKLPNPVYYLP